jgi:TfoX/Sxy family transcriptional regulator of competence genes
MAFDEGLAEILRGDLADLPGITEKKMFGGIAFMMNGNMLCGVHSGGAMFRVGKEREAEALAIDGARPMDFTGRRMGGFVDVGDEALADDARRGAWMRLAQAYAGELPAK